MGFLYGTKEIYRKKSPRKTIFRKNSEEKTYGRGDGQKKFIFKVLY